MRKKLVATTSLVFAFAMSAVALQRLQVAAVGVEPGLFCGHGIL